ncbi:hypothetical protein DIU31_000035 [Mucilaginibacter rubeus]|uniref:Uncharacterized protein n=1 Tax=Mucilaginibacter rubeus TaxID=2027860 RepID=A0AAE6MG96_9SPHI|nr:MULTISPECIES: hypothetical protein [Mucilaginibacter]QEM01984.1 hypothetical protein DIU31_000035 [Mucilaginibacter rubeus]QEM14612.1 hypothetical protein DIU38_000035 [Mucilaginibacter gossypii]QTE42683.1 hypothetical protein J3L19_27770 [Mucilaginibacter rubeus]QTE49284.1 hypothetical protein J3L21_27730 [Mucilaginibacter rubeus]QTE54381.1 hypothetical protein J3L23_19355 [Mucilaginibacter rubeus]
MQKDFILREIEKIVYSITRLAGLKNAANPEAFIQHADQMLQDEYDLKLNDLLELSIEDFDILLNERNYSPEKLDALANLLYMYYEPFEANDETLAALQTIISIFNQLEKNHNRASFENINKRNAIYQFLQKNYE